MDGGRRRERNTDLQLMCNEQDRLLLQQPTNALVKYVLTDMGVDCRQWIVQ